MMNPAFTGLNRSSEQKSEFDMYVMLAHLDMTMYGVDPGVQQLSLVSGVADDGLLRSHSQFRDAIGSTGMTSSCPWCQQIWC